MSYHWHLDYENPWIKECYQKAMDSGVYENVDFVLGGKMKAYAATNQMEYFSECTEAFWGMNDYFPFNKSQLRTDSTHNQLQKQTEKILPFP